MGKERDGAVHEDSISTNYRSVLLDRKQNLVRLPVALYASIFLSHSRRRWLSSKRTFHIKNISSFEHFMSDGGDTSGSSASPPTYLDLDYRRCTAHERLESNTLTESRNTTV